MSRFGKLLRQYRIRCIDPDRERPLSQERLGELLGRVLNDDGRTGAAVSEWERDKSRIALDQRPVLVALIQVLHEGGGLSTLDQANSLLLAGDYRQLDEQEQQRIFSSRASAPDQQTRGPEAAASPIRKQPDRLSEESRADVAARHTR